MAGPLVVPPPPPGGPLPMQKTSEIIGTLRPTKVSRDPTILHIRLVTLTSSAIQTLQIRSLSHIPRLRRLRRILPGSLLRQLSPLVQRQRRKTSQDPTVSEIRRPPRPLHPPPYLNPLHKHKRRRLYTLPLHPRQCLPPLLPWPYRPSYVPLPRSISG